jgi:hypothetical protein
MFRIICSNKLNVFKKSKNTKQAVNPCKSYAVVTLIIHDVRCFFIKLTWIFPSYMLVWPEQNLSVQSLHKDSLQWGKAGLITLVKRMFNFFLV